jgi:flavin reductase (DIM6/NTAB) family NADH-FMN oxidoreductase RutF
MTDLRQDFLNGMSCVAATVNVVTTDGPAGRAGVTVSAMSSVSADTEKPVLLVCVNDQSAGAAPIIENGVFTINILRDDQSFVSDTFAGRYGDKGEDKFACAEWDRGTTGAPILRGALASFDCKLIDDRMVGQHHVFFGEVQEVRIAERGRALIYANRSYSTALSLPPAQGKPAHDTGKRICVACVSSFAPLYLPDILVGMREHSPDVRVDVIEGDQVQVAHLVETGEAELGLTYSYESRPVLSEIELARCSPYTLFPKGHSLAEESSVTLEQLAEEPMILLDQPVSRSYLTGLFKAQGIAPHIAMRTPSFELVRSLVGSGLGYAILVTAPASECSYDGEPLVRRPISGHVQTIPIVLASRKKVELSPQAKVFGDLCRSLFPA